ncbi:MAG: hypothetical protein ACKV19_21790 [Verrucomicrobiales bacterium]
MTALLFNMVAVQAAATALTDENFSSAMAENYFQEVIDRGGVNKFAHLCQVSSVEAQNILLLRPPVGNPHPELARLGQESLR